MFFSIITKNPNWEILAKNFVPFKRGGVDTPMHTMTFNYFVRLLLTGSHCSIDCTFVSKLTNSVG